jgi:murein DD-endopeptidase MepM/ murein hydrolase activator NlpD
VSFSGVVAGRGIVVVTHAGGLRTTYEPVARRVGAGTPVEAGDVLGTLAPWSSHCTPRACLHWGLRRGEIYLDPLALVDRGPPVLLPLG